VQGHQEIALSIIYAVSGINNYFVELNNLSKKKKKKKNEKPMKEKAK